MKYLINRSDAIGDNILTTPMAQAISELDPEAEIGIITSYLCRDLYHDHPYIKKVFFFDKKDSYWHKIKKSLVIFKEFMPDFYFYVGGSQTPNFVAWLKSVPFRGGILSRWTTFLVLNKGVRQKRSQVAQHEIFYNVDLLRHLHGFENVDDKDYLPTMNLPKEEKEKNIQEFKEIIKEAGLNSEREYIFIHPGMTGHTLNWPSRNYGRLIKRLSLIYKDRFNFIISHTPSDKPYLVGIEEEIGELINTNDNKCVYFFDGSKKGLLNYMTILKDAKFFMGPSTGTTHIAATLGVPVVSIYSPIKAQSALRWGPKGSGEIHVIAPNVVCGETLSCAKEDCPYYECMSKIEVDEVLKNIKLILEK